MSAGVRSHFDAKASEFPIGEIAHVNSEWAYDRECYCFVRCQGRMTLSLSAGVTSPRYISQVSCAWRSHVIRNVNPLFDTPKMTPKQANGYWIDPKVDFHVAREWCMEEFGVQRVMNGKETENGPDKEKKKAKQ
jgi:hypothetical protein